MLRHKRCALLIFWHVDYPAHQANNTYFHIPVERFVSHRCCFSVLSPFTKDKPSIYMSFYIAVARQQCSPIATYFAIIMLRMLIHMAVDTTFATFLQRKMAINKELQFIATLCFNFIIVVITISAWLTNLSCISLL